MSSERRDQIDSLQRLLGTGRYEVGCDACFDLLDEYVEIELSGADPEARLPGLRAHLEGCQACREEHDSLVVLASRDRAPD